MILRGVAAGSSGLWPAETTLHVELSSLREQATQLSTRLSKAADELAGRGHLSDVGMLADLAQYREQFLAVVEMVTKQTRQTHPQLAGSSLTSLGQIDRVLEDHQRRRSALSVIDELCLLEAVGVAEFEPLASTQREARRIQQQMLGSSGAWPADVDARLKDFSALMTMVNESSELTDTDWNVCYDRVCAAFGREMGTAAARGRLQTHLANLT